MYYFKPGWRPEQVEIMGNDLNELVAHLLQSQSAPPPIAPPLPPFVKETARAKHIGQYIEHVMFALGHSILDLTITKDDDGSLIFEIINKEK
jgi:hypothetical protein